MARDHASRYLDGTLAASAYDVRLLVIGDCQHTIRSEQNNQLLNYQWQLNPTKGGKCDARPESAFQNWKMAQVTELDWPLAKRIADALDVLETLSKYRDDAIFRPSPVRVAFSLSAAREALQLLAERSNA